MRHTTIGDLIFLTISTLLFVLLITATMYTTRAIMSASPTQPASETISLQQVVNKHINHP